VKPSLCLAQPCLHSRRAELGCCSDRR
jgi:hypothetical protein